MWSTKLIWPVCWPCHSSKQLDGSHIPSRAIATGLHRRSRAPSWRCLHPAQPRTCSGPSAAWAGFPYTAKKAAASRFGALRIQLASSNLLTVSAFARAKVTLTPTTFDPHTSGS